jgi:type VI protein secretion system component Hcp
MLEALVEFGIISSELKKYLDRPSDEEMVETVLEWYNASSKREQAEFITTDFENLVVFMSSLGQNILKTFNLWYYTWDKKIKDGVDVSEEHPEAVALRVIEETWRQLQDES